VRFPLQSKNPVSASHPLARSSWVAVTQQKDPVQPAEFPGSRGASRRTSGALFWSTAQAGAANEAVLPERTNHSSCRVVPASCPRLHQSPRVTAALLPLKHTIFQHVPISTFILVYSLFRFPFCSPCKLPDHAFPTLFLAHASCQQVQHPAIPRWGEHKSRRPFAAIGCLGPCRVHIPL